MRYIKHTLDTASIDAAMTRAV